MIVNTYQLDVLCGRYVGKNTIHMEKKDLRITSKDVGKMLSIPYGSGYVNIYPKAQSQKVPDFYAAHFKRTDIKSNHYNLIFL